MAVMATSSSAVIVTASKTISSAADRPTWRSLSTRELEVLRWLSYGKSAEDVAAILNLSISTVMFHCRSAAHKYGTANRTHTVAEAFRRGELPINDELQVMHGGHEIYDI